MISKDIISIIVTTCCQSDYRLSLLKTSMRNLFINTDMTRKQLIFCDNGDERQTEYLNSLPYGRCLSFGENRGIVYARNAGAEQATGDYICFVDGDLIYRRDWIRVLKHLLVRNSNFRLIASGRMSDNMLKTKTYFVDFGFRHQIWSRTAGGCLMMSKEAWNEVGPWPDCWKMGSAFCNNANKKKYNFIIPIPEVAMPLDYRPSYNKKKLMASYLKNEEMVWEMIR